MQHFKPAGENEMASLRLSVYRIMSKLSFGMRGNYSHMRNVSVDVPLSQETFHERICKHLQEFEYLGQDNLKVSVCPSDLNAVFGDNWFQFNFESSSTRNRVLGLVTIHYRVKKIMRLGFVVEVNNFRSNNVD